jgi:hypothetical protein
MRRLHVLVAVTAVLAIVMAGCGGGTTGPQGRPTPRTTAPGTAERKARRDFCEDLLLIQSGFRPDALARLLPQLRQDAAEFEGAGDHEAAQTVHRLASAVGKLRAALIDEQGVTRARNEVEAVLTHLPGC